MSGSTGCEQTCCIALRCPLPALIPGPGSEASTDLTCRCNDATVSASSHLDKTACSTGLSPTEHWLRVETTALLFDLTKFSKAHQASTPNSSSSLVQSSRHASEQKTFPVVLSFTARFRPRSYPKHCAQTSFLYCLKITCAAGRGESRTCVLAGMFCCARTPRPAPGMSCTAIRADEGGMCSF